MAAGSCGKSFVFPVRIANRWATRPQVSLISAISNFWTDYPRSWQTFHVLRFDHAFANALFCVCTRAPAYAAETVDSAADKKNSENVEGNADE
jgi:hypothetical protein